MSAYVCEQGREIEEKRENEEDESNLINVSGTHSPYLFSPVYLDLNSSYYYNFDYY